MRRDCTDSDMGPRDHVIDELEGNWLVSKATLPRLPRFHLSRNACALPCRDTCALPSGHGSTRHACGRAPPVTPLLTPSRNASAPPRIVVQHSPPSRLPSPPPVTLPLAPFRNASAPLKSSSLRRHCCDSDVCRIYRNCSAFGGGGGGIRRR